MAEEINFVIFQLVNPISFSTSILYKQILFIIYLKIKLFLKNNLNYNILIAYKKKNLKCDKMIYLIIVKLVIYSVQSKNFLKLWP